MTCLRRALQQGSAQKPTMPGNSALPRACIYLLLLCVFIAEVEPIPYPRPHLEKDEHCCPLNETLLWRKTIRGMNQASIKELSRFLDYQFYLPELQLRAGLKYPSSGKRLRKFVSDLLKGTRPLKVGVVGGSISWGQGTTRRGERDWFSVFMTWLASAARGRVTGLNGCIPGSPSLYMVLCLEHSVDPRADLVLVEYVFNDGLDDTLKNNSIVRSKEQLVRRLMDLPGQPAVVLVQVPHVHVRDFEPFFRTSEDLEGAVAAYYDVPTVSLRNALFPLNVHRPTPGYLWHQMYNEHHPGDAGHKALADLAVHLIQETAAGLLLSPQSREEVAKLKLPLPPPMYPDNLPPTTSTCMVGSDFAALATTTEGWEWVNEGTPTKPKWGFVATRPGSLLVVQLSVGTAGAGGDDAATAAATGAADPVAAEGEAAAGGQAAAAPPPAQGVPVMLHYLRSYTGMGMALVECGGGCGCPGVTLDGMHRGHASQVAMEPFMVRWTDPRVACELRVTVLNETHGGKAHKFKVSGVVVAHGYGAAALTQIDNWNVPNDD